MDTREAKRANKCNTNTANCQGSGYKQHYTNTDAGSWKTQIMLHKDSNSKSDNKDKSMVIDNENSRINYILPGPIQDNEKRASSEITQKLQRGFKDVFTGIGCFDGTFSLQLKPDSKPYQELPSWWFML